MRQKKHSGMTLLEMILTLVVGLAILSFGLRQYQIYSFQSDMNRLRLTTDQLFNAMANYYRAQCHSFPISTPAIPVTVVTLQQDGFLSDPLYSPLVDNTGNAGYITQFILGPLTNRYYYACWIQDGATTCTLPELTAANPTVTLWYIQIAIKIANSTKAKALAYQGMLSATCVSDSPNACNENAGNPSYLIWQRLPSFVASSKKLSSYWLSMPAIEQFNLQYSHDQMYEFENTAYANSEGAYYLCGG